MYELVVERFFDITHAVRQPGGALEPFHRHRWQLEVQVSSEELDAFGFCVDFLSLDALVGDVVTEVDGENLNELTGLREKGAPTESAARLLFHRIAGRVPGGAQLDRVTIIRDEMPRVRVTYRPGPRR